MCLSFTAQQSLRQTVPSRAKPRGFMSHTGTDHAEPAKLGRARGAGASQAKTRRAAQKRIQPKNDLHKNLVNLRPSAQICHLTCKAYVTSNRSVSFFKYIYQIYTRPLFPYININIYMKRDREGCRESERNCAPASYVSSRLPPPQAAAAIPKIVAQVHLTKAWFAR